jgi:hypothetical protein
MNTIHNNGENDQTLNDGLEKLGQAYGRLEQDEPPDLLDQAILNSAHRAVEKRSGWKRFGWMHGLATAAVFVLAFTVILDQRELSPGLKEDVSRNAPSRLESSEEIKKQSADKIGKSAMEMESSAEIRRKTNMSDAPATATEPMELSREVPGEQPMDEVLSELRVQAAAVQKSEHADTDDSNVNALQEELLMGEADVLTDTPSVDTASMQVMPTSVATPESSALKARGRMDLTDLTIEQELQSIIKLKKSGDDTWVTELEAFVERFPDYPLPDELKN